MVTIAKMGDPLLLKGKWRAVGAKITIMLKHQTLLKSSTSKGVMKSLIVEYSSEGEKGITPI